MATPAAQTPPPFIPLPVSIEKAVVQPWLIGTIFACTFFGWGLLQMYNCFSIALQDPRRHWQTIVILSVLFVSDVADSVFKSMQIIQWVNQIIDQGELGIVHFPRITFSVPFIHGWIAAICQLVYLRRIYQMVKRKGFFTWTVIIICLGGITTQFVFTVLSSFAVLNPFPEWAEKLKFPGVAAFFTESAVDLILCGMFIWNLQRLKSDYADTNRTITKWILLTFETNLVTSGLQIANGVLILALPKNASYGALVWALTKVYIISILTVFHRILENIQRNAENDAALTNSNSNIGSKSGGGHSGIRNRNGGRSGQGVGNNSRPGVPISSNIRVVTSSQQHVSQEDDIYDIELGKVDRPDFDSMAYLEKRG